MAIRRYDSLRNRYAAVAGILIVLVLAGAVVANQMVANARHETTANIELRSKFLERSRHIRTAVWEAREGMVAFLLQPDAQSRDVMFRAIRRARGQTRDLADQPWVRSHGLAPTVDDLQNSLEQLNQGVRVLVEIRTDPRRQYPALKYARGTMLPQVREINTAVNLALEEVNASTGQKGGSEARDAFVRVRYLWSRMIATFRMYLINRLGTLDEDMIDAQVSDIATYYNGIRAELGRLEQLDRDGALGLQASAAREHIHTALDQWYEDFSKVREIQGQAQWRTDIRQLTGTIGPLLTRIWGNLKELDLSIEQATIADVQLLTDVAHRQSRMIWLMTALALIFIGLGFVALERWVLRPIATVARALKSEAIGGHGGHLPRARTRETRDLTDAFAEMRQQVHHRQVALEHQALHDSLTDLPNRTLLMDRLQQAIYAARREKSQLSLLMMDLDRFKEINDTLGHHAGDQLLQAVGARLLESLRETDTVARLGGDEFAILLPNTEMTEARNIASKIANRMERVFSVDGHNLYVRASMGIAAYPQHGASSQTLIQRADVAMYVAKRNKVNLAVYDPREDRHSVGRLALVSDLRRALDTDALDLHYQPKVSLHQNQVVGAEALLRWRHPRYGLLPPDEVIPLAEQTGLIKSLTLWVADRAIRQAAVWHRRGLALVVTINLSAYDLQDTGLVDQLREILDRYALEPQHLALEITEGAMMSDPAHAVEILTRLDEMGMRLAIDDFGTGFSSLAYLKQLPVDELKIDKSFVIDMDDEENDAVIVRSTIDLAHNLGLQVVAEGVENADTLSLLKILGCDFAQGYHISRPLPAWDVASWLESNGATVGSAVAALATGASGTRSRS